MISKDYEQMGASGVWSNCQKKYKTVNGGAFLVRVSI